MVDPKLNEIGESKDWLSDPKIFGNYNVAYVAAGKSERDNPAGGRFRGRLGRALFRQVSRCDKMANFLSAADCDVLNLLAVHDLTQQTWTPRSALSTGRYRCWFSDAIL